MRKSLMELKNFRIKTPSAARMPPIFLPAGWEPW